MPKDPHITGGIRHDWATIEHEYLTDPDATLRKLAEKYGVSKNAIYKKSKAEGWFATRKKTQAKAVAKAVAKTTNRMATELSLEADFLALMEGHVGRMLKDEKQYQRQLIVNPVTGETEERLTEKFDSRSMKDSMQILQMMEAMTRSIYNLQKAETIQKHQLEAERLQLDREKFEWEKQKAEYARPDSSNSIRIEGFEEGWAE
jgi:hypothetical protein